MQQGGGWTALCHSILSNENNIADLTRNGSPAVKSLFKTSLGGGKPGGFLTTNGFPDHRQHRRARATVNPIAADLPVAQVVPTTTPQALPGGSVQTWPAPGIPGAPTYWSNTERVGYFDTPTVDHDNIIAGTYHDGTGAGKLTYIGGHSFSTSLPYAGNAEAPYLRAFYNSLFFNGSAVAKLDLTLLAEHVPAERHGAAEREHRQHGRQRRDQRRQRQPHARARLHATSRRRPGRPRSSIGQTLTWPGGLGDIAGGATAVTIQVSVASSVSGTLGVEAVRHAPRRRTATSSARRFTANLCRDITVTPVPGADAHEDAGDTGPRGHRLAGDLDARLRQPGRRGAARTRCCRTRCRRASRTSPAPRRPSLPAPTVIPSPDGTIVRWNVGTIAAGTPNAGTVTITAKAGAVTDGTGTPPQQTFTNDADARGQGRRRQRVHGRRERRRGRPGARPHARQVGRQDVHRLAAEHGHVHAHAEVGQRRLRSTTCA